MVELRCTIFERDFQAKICCHYLVVIIYMFFFIVKFIISVSACIDPMQKWLPLNYSLVCIQKNLTGLVQDNKFFGILMSKTKLVRLF